MRSLLSEKAVDDDEAKMTSPVQIEALASERVRNMTRRRVTRLEQYNKYHTFMSVLFLTTGPSPNPPWGQ
jgi:hypothetical protein